MGCGVAALAMILCRSYADVLRDWPIINEQCDHWEDGKVIGKRDVTYNDFTKDGISHLCADAYLCDQGYSVQRKYQYRSCVRKNREKWPPEPWADVHLCEVKTSQFHFVVMLRDGEILDPAFGRGRKLADYERIYSVAAVYKVGEVKW